MEIEEMQALWSDMTEQLNQQKKLTNEIILKMTQQQYQQNIRRIAYPEQIGAVICFAAALFIIFNGHKLDTLISQICGVLTLLVLIVLPVLSLFSIQQMNKINILTTNYKETLVTYLKGRQLFQKIQKLGFYLGFVLMVTIQPVIFKIVKGQDFQIKSYTWIIGAIIVALIFYFFMTTRVYRYYKGNLTAAETTIRELEQL